MKRNSLVLKPLLLVCILQLSLADLPAPVLEQQSYVNETAFQISWLFPDNVTVSGFVVRATGVFLDNSTNQVTTSGSDRSVLLTGLLSGETYVVVVEAVNGTQNTSSQEVQVNTVPFQPQISVAASTVSSLTFNWSLPVGVKVKSFTVYLSPDSNPFNFVHKEVVGDVLETTFYNLTSTVDYTLSLVSNGYNGLSSSYSSIKYSTDIPEIVTTLGITYTSSITVYWAAKDLLYLSGPFLVEYYGSNVDTEARNKTVGSSDRSTDLTGLISGETYFVSVTMETEVSKGTSNLASATTKLFAPVFDQSSQTMTMLTLNWTSSNGYVALYQLSYSGVAQDMLPRVWNVTGNDTQTALTGLTPGVQYRVEIVAISNTETSPSDSILKSTMPGPVQNLVSVETDADVLRVRWDAPAEGYVENYEVSISNFTTGEIIAIETTYAPGYDRFNILPDAMYTVVVRSLANDGLPSSPVSVIVHQGEIAPPSDIAHEANHTVIVISWTHPISSSYVRVECQSCPEDPVQEINASDPPVAVFANVASGSTHLITLQTFEDERFSDQIVLFLTTIPEAPVVEVQSSGEDFIILTLSINSCTSCSYTAHATSELEAVTVPVEFERGSTQSTFEMQLNSLEAGTLYTIEVVAELNSLESEPAVVMQQTDLARPTNLMWTVNSTAISFSWTPPTGLFDAVTIECSCEQTHVVNYTDTPLVVFTGIQPGSTSFVHVQTVRDGFQSPVSELLIIATSPEPPDRIEILNADPTQITISIHDLDCTSCVYTGNATAAGLNATVVTYERVPSESVFSMTFDDLVPGTEYLIEVFSVLNQLASMPTNITARTSPLPLQDIEISQVTSSGFTLFWEATAGNVDAYIITLDPPHVQVPVQSEQGRFYIFRNLHAFSEYAVSLAVQSGSQISDGVEEVVTTLEGIPGKVTNLTVHLADNDAIVQFNPPLQVFGILEGYSISHIGQFPGFPVHSDVRLIHASGQKLVIFEDLKRGYNYTYTVSAKNSLNFGESSRVWTVIPSGAPPPSDTKPPAVLANDVTDTSFPVIINHGLFSDENGPISKFTIIVAEEEATGGSIGGETGDSSNSDLPSWSQVINRNPIPRYQISELMDYSIVRNGAEVRKKRQTQGITIDIGTENCSMAVTGFCNGPLKPGKTYVYQYRGFTENGFYSDTPYSDPVGTLKGDDGTTNPITGNNNDTVIVGVVLGLVILLLVGLITILVYSYRTKNAVLRTIVGKDGTFHEPKTAQHPVHLTSMKLHPHEKWDLNFAQFESNVIQEQKNNYAGLNGKHITGEDESNGVINTNGVSNMQRDSMEETSFTTHDSVNPDQPLHEAIDINGV